MTPSARLDPGHVVLDAPASAGARGRPPGDPPTASVPATTCANASLEVRPSRPTATMIRAAPGGPIAWRDASDERGGEPGADHFPDAVRPEEPHGRARRLISDNGFGARGRYRGRGPLRAWPSPRWMVDEMLGRLARSLRVLGHDTVYVTGLPDADIADRASRESRVLVTRDKALAARVPGSVLLTSGEWSEQIRAAARRPSRSILGTAIRSLHLVQWGPHAPSSRGGDARDRCLFHAPGRPRRTGTALPVSGVRPSVLGREPHSPDA